MCKYSTEFRVFLSKMQAVCHINTQLNNNGCAAKSLFNNIGSDIQEYAEEQMESESDKKKKKKKGKNKSNRQRQTEKNNRNTKKRAKINQKTKKAKKGKKGKNNIGKKIKKGFKKLELVWKMIGKLTSMLKLLWSKLDPVWLALNTTYKIWLIRKWCKKHFLNLNLYSLLIISFLLHIGTICCFFLFFSFHFFNKNFTFSLFLLHTSLYSRD